MKINYRLLPRKIGENATYFLQWGHIFSNCLNKLYATNNKMMQLQMQIASKCSANAICIVLS